MFDGYGREEYVVLDRFKCARFRRNYQVNDFLKYIEFHQAHLLFIAIPNLLISYWSLLMILGGTTRAELCVWYAGTLRSSIVIYILFY